jgi:hypothetical protein
MTAVATAVAVGVDSKLTIPNLSLVFVVPVIIAGVSLGLGPSLCSAILGVALRCEVKATPLTMRPTTNSSPIAQMFAGSSTASE